MIGRALWSAFEAAAATGGALCSRAPASAKGSAGAWPAEEWAATGVSIDTRTLRPGDLFVALKDARDGHDFVRAAFDAGASAALVARAPDDAPADKPLLVVRDTLDGLRDLARAARVRNFGKRVGVTGSAGKTSTKEMLRCALAGEGQVHAAAKSFNNHWGVPLTLAETPMGADFGVYEIGMNHAGEITPLTKLVKPDVAIVTTVAAAHLEFFDSIEGIAEAKAEIFLGVAPRGAAVLPLDNDHYALLRQRAEEAGIKRLISFGAREGADVRLLSYGGDAEAGSIEADVMGERVAFRLGAPGEHMAMNALAVLGATAALGLPVAGAAERLARFGAGAGRGEAAVLDLSGGRRILLLDESYNANPASMPAAFKVFAAAASPRGNGTRVAVLGEMRELGPDGPQLHADLAEPLQAAGVGVVHTSGPLMASLRDRLPDAMRGRHVEDAEAGPAAIAEALVQDLRDGDMVMVKGSNASMVSAVVAALRAAAAGGTADENGAARRA
ncbi:MAG: UDP-N-acetylmuramoyl-tripeptide--D-alanyl-D-alanine ligase [Parvularculaceae bacterium]